MSKKALDLLTQRKQLLANGVDPSGLTYLLKQSQAEGGLTTEEAFALSLYSPAKTSGT